MLYPRFPITAPSSQCLSSILAPSLRNMLSSIFSQLHLQDSFWHQVLTNSSQTSPFGFQAFSCRPTALVSFRTKYFVMFVFTIMANLCLPFLALWPPLSPTSWFPGDLGPLLRFYLCYKWMVKDASVSVTETHKVGGKKGCRLK